MAVMSAEEAWALAKEILVDGLTNQELREMFGDEEFGVQNIFKLPPQVVKSKLDEARKPKIGDIVRIKSSGVMGFLAGIDGGSETTEAVKYQVSIPKGDSRAVYTYKLDEIETTGECIEIPY